MSKKRRPSIKPIELEAARFIGAGDYANLRRFLLEGVDPTAQDGALLHEVVRYGEQGMLQLLLDHQVRIPRSRQAPLLAMAVASAAPEVLEMMIDHLGDDAAQSALRRNGYSVIILAGDVSPVDVLAVRSALGLRVAAPGLPRAAVDGSRLAESPSSLGSFWSSQ